MVHASAASLMQVINDILDVTKIEAGRLAVEPVTFRLREWLDVSAKPFAMKAREKRLGFSTDVAPDVPDEIVCDPMRLRQILTNLMGNGIKFTEHGDVTVRLQVHERTASELMLLISVADTGIGIPLDQQASVFEAFTQADGSTTRRYGGTGLGLTISHTLVELMSGRLWLESEPGRGSTFYFTVKVGLPAGDAAPIGLASAPTTTTLNVLLVDDNVVNRQLGARLLEKQGHTVTVATGGREALQILEDARFDVVVMDVQMPDVDGLQATTTIRAAEEKTGAHLPIIAMTAHAMSGDRERCLQAGMDGYVSKPIDRERLIAEIRRVVPA